jgi:hypothetical protein
MAGRWTHDYFGLLTHEYPVLGLRSLWPTEKAASQVIVAARELLDSDSGLIFFRGLLQAIGCLRANNLIPRSCILFITTLISYTNSSCT